MNLKTIDLCAGIGGIRRGFELAGDYRNIASAEIDEMACKTYEHLFHEDPRNDVTSEEFKIYLVKSSEYSSDQKDDFIVQLYSSFAQQDT